MLKLYTFEIPSQKSLKTLSIPQDFLESEDITVLEGTLHLDIDRSDHMIHIKSMVTSTLELQCDRSLDKFQYSVQHELDIIYKEGLKEEEYDLHLSCKRLEQHQQTLEFEQDVRDMLLLSLPPKRIHPRYLDDNGNLIELLNKQFGSTVEDSETVDPRWEALKNLKN